MEFNEATELYRAFHMLLPLLLLLASLVQPCRKRTFYYALYIVNLDPVVKQKKEAFDANDVAETAYKSSSF